MEDSDELERLRLDVRRLHYELERARGALTGVRSYLIACDENGASISDGMIMTIVRQGL